MWKAKDEHWSQILSPCVADTSAQIFSQLHIPPALPVGAWIPLQTPSTTRPRWTSSTSWATPRLRSRPSSSSLAPTRTRIKSWVSWSGSELDRRPSRNPWPPCLCWCPEGTTRIHPPPYSCLWPHHLLQVERTNTGRMMFSDPSFLMAATWPWGERQIQTSEALHNPQPNMFREVRSPGGS